MAETVICHAHPDIQNWVHARTRAKYPGLRQSFEAACKYAEDKTYWQNTDKAHAFVEYVPEKHPFTYSMILKIRIEEPYITVIGVALLREKCKFVVK